ncbi:MAG: DUF885 domain-containing protein [Calditrichaeota bacterium]|nr:DUF885 domain-containing protein [Calditrichota bacterium]
MKKSLRCRLQKLVFFFILIGLTLPQCSKFFANRKVDRLFSDYLVWFERHFPVEASNRGLRDSDGWLPDFSPDSVAVAIRQLREFSRRIDEIKPNSLSPNQRSTRQILQRQIRLHLFELEHWKRWQIDANFYVQKMQDAVFPLSILLTDSTEQYAKPLIRRLELLPKLMKQLKKNVADFSATDQEVAVKRAVDLEKWIGFELRSQLRDHFQKADTTARLIAVVNDSLLKLIRFLDGKAVADSSRLAPFKKSDFQNYLKISLDDSVSLPQLRAQLAIELKKMKGEMFRLAKEHFEERNKDIAAIDTVRLIRLFDNAIKNEMLRRDQIENFIRNFDGYTRRFIPDIANLNISVNYPLQFKWEKLKGENPFQLIWRETIFTAPLRPIFIARLSAVNGNRDLFAQLSILRRYNKAAFKQRYLTEILPVHYFNWENAAPEMVLAARVFPDQIAAESWPYFFARYLIKRGFSGYDRGVKFMLIKKITSMIICAYSELSIYLDDWQEKQMLRFLSDNKDFSDETISEMKFKIYSQPAHDLKILIGLEKFQKLYLLHQSLLREQYHPSNFFEKILKQGPVPISIIQKKLQSKKE